MCEEFSGEQRQAVRIPATLLSKPYPIMIKGPHTLCNKTGLRDPPQLQRNSKDAVRALLNDIVKARPNIIRLSRVKTYTP